MGYNHPSRVLLREYLQNNSQRARELFSRISTTAVGELNAYEILDAQVSSFGLLFEEVIVHNAALDDALNNLARYAHYSTLPSGRPFSGQSPPRTNSNNCTIAAPKAAIVIYGAYA